RRNRASWSTAYVETGPFRLSAYGNGGEQLVCDRFADYFLGKARVDRIVVRALADSNLILANIRSGAIDIASKDSLSSDTAIQLDTDWRQSGEGTVLYSPAASGL